MTAPLIQPSFAAGELSPNLYARVDLAKFHIGAARLYNCWVDYRGGVTSRAGTQFVAMAAKPLVRLIKFEFSISQTYVLEFSDRQMRVVKNGGMVLAGSGAPYTLATPWAEADLALLKFAQSNDVMTFTHPDYPIFDLTRFAENDWRLSQVGFGYAVGPPNTVTTATTPAFTGAGETCYAYQVTSVDKDGVESQPSAVIAANTGSFALHQQSISLSWSPVTGAVSYNVYKAVPIVNSSLTANNYPANQTFGFMASTKGFSAVDTNIVPDFAKAPPTHRNPFAAGAVTSIRIDASGDNYTNASNPVVASTTGSGFLARVLLAGTGSSPGGINGLLILNPGQDYTSTDTLGITAPGSGFVGAPIIGPTTGLYPGVVTYFQQRKVYAASRQAPATWWASKIGTFNNMDISIPVKDDNALTFTLAALEQNPIKYMIPVQNGLIMLTGGAAWLVSGGSNGEAVTPTAIRQTPQVYNGCADVVPLLIGTNLLYVQQKGYVVQDLKFDFLSNVYTGEDRTYLSSHLFRGRQVKEWCWSAEPQKLIWAVMSDGKLLTMTYIKEQEVFGWAQHETTGTVTSICCIPEGDEDVVYLAVTRASGTMLERMASRRVTTMLDAWGLDCALRYQGSAVATVTGLDHLNGQLVTVVADGVVAGQRLVDAGTISLSAPAENILVGLAFDTQFQSLYADAGQPTMQGKRKTIPAMTTRILNTKGLNVGATFGTLVPVKELTPTGGPISQIGLFSGDWRTVMDTSWGTYGQVCVQGTPGLPWSLTAIMPEVGVGN